MQGLYIHIPFCTQACHYCDFHFSTNMSLKTEMVNSICREIELQCNYLKSLSFETIYFGGGTPSLLNFHETERILDTLHKNFQISPKAEITLEANPDDLTLEKVKDLNQLGFNRLSIGIQSFDNEHLKYLHRIHSSQEAEASVKRAQDQGFENISIDLIYGIPSPDHAIWLKDLQTALLLNVQHISSYCLTIEPSTVFGNWVKTNKIKNVDEDFAAFQFELLMTTLEEHGYEHYEISNFCKPELHSRHNSNYWLGGHYLGLGPAAHSYNGESRQSNISNNATYVQSINQHKIPLQKETLSEKDKINEYLMTGIRTKWGCDFFKLKSDFRIDLSEYEKIIASYKNEGFLDYENGVVRLTKKGKLIADKITSDFFVI